MDDKSYALLSSGLETLGLTLVPEKIKVLLAFVALIEKWNNAYNLTSVRDKQQMLTRHILDSLTLLPYLQGPKVIDIGTGAGLPGIPLAIIAEQCDFVLLDSNAKKTRFVQQAIIELKLHNVQVRHDRAENFHASVGFNSVISRAFASIPEMRHKTAHLLHEKGVMLAMKGQNPAAELAEAPASLLEVIPLHVPGVDAERCLVRIRRQ